MSSVNNGFLNLVDHTMWSHTFKNDIMIDLLFFLSPGLKPGAMEHEALNLHLCLCSFLYIQFAL